MTPLGQLPFFIDFLKTSRLFDALVSDCPLRYQSPNAPKRRDVLGTTMLSMLAGHKRYAHIAALRCDAVLPELLGMEEDRQRGRRQTRAEGDRGGGRRGVAAPPSRPLPGAASERAVDSRRRYDDQTALRPSGRSGARLQSEEARPSEPLSSQLCDGADAAGSRRRRAPRRRAHVQTTARRGCGRCWIACRATAGRRCCAATPALASNRSKAEAEARGAPYLFKLRLTANVKRMIEKLAGARAWVDAGAGFEAKESSVRLTGWSRRRRAIVLRRRIRDGLALAAGEESNQPRLSFAEIDGGAEVWEYSVLINSLDEEISAFGQLYRDRGDSENAFDELKNQWGWGGFTTRDLARCRLAARLLALFYDWWNIFVRLAEPDRRREAVASRPLLLADIAARTRHARQTTIRVTSSHAKALSRRQGAGGGRGVLAPADQKCGAVDEPANLVRHSRPRLQGLPRPRC